MTDDRYIEPPEHLGQAAEQLRAFNHTSRSVTDGWRFPSDSYRALGRLTDLAGMLVQALQQAAVPVRYTYEHGRIRIDGGGDPDAKVSELLTAQRSAATAADALYEAVNAMWSATSPMGLDTDGIPQYADDEAGGDA